MMLRRAPSACGQDGGLKEGRERGRPACQAEKQIEDRLLQVSKALAPVYEDVEF